MLEERVRDFFALARERYRIHLSRDIEKTAGPWTNDPIFQKYRFCNLFREDDKTTRWFAQRVRNHLKWDGPAVLFSTIAFRWFNRITTGEKIFAYLRRAVWDKVAYRELLKDQKPVVTGAYIIKTPNGMNKLDGVLWCIDQIADSCFPLARQMCDGAPTLEQAWRLLREFPYLGDFMAYEVVTDLRHTCLLHDAGDVNHWCNPGPGCTRGLGRIFERNPDHFNRASHKDRAVMFSHMRELLHLSTMDEFWPHSHGRAWEMREVEHWLCEYEKYARVREGGAPPKERFKS